MELEITSDSNNDNKKGSPTQKKVDGLKKQYNDLITAAFKKYAPDAIEDALESAEGAFGQDIEGLLSTALDSLKTKVLEDFGVESSAGCGAIMAVGMGDGDNDDDDEVITLGDEYEDESEEYESETEDEDYE